MAERDKPHLYVPDSARPERYQSKPRRIDAIAYPRRNRRDHGRRLRRELTSAARDGEGRRAELPVHVEGVTPGFYFEFESFPESEVKLKLESLESKRAGIELVTVREVDGVLRAVVFVPDGQLKYFINRFERYLTEHTEKGKPKHRDLVESIGAIRLASLQALWTDDLALYPGEDERVWWEIWLRRTDGEEPTRLQTFAEASGMTLRADALRFPDRTVMLAEGTARALAQSLDVLDDIAEVRKAKEAPTRFLSLSPTEQIAEVSDLAERLEVVSSEGAPAVCVLDTGVNRGHPLLVRSLDESDCHTYFPDWGADDREGHGTEMAGLALLGNITPLLSGTHTVAVRHRLESVKILPNHGSNPPELYGYITEESAARVEVGAPDRNRVFSLAISADDWRDAGRPSSWSAAIDQLAAAPDDTEEAKRLFLIAAGNRRGEPTVDHLAASDTESIHDPGQAWNAITVGAWTELFEITEPEFSGWTPVAEPGELAPNSTTSLLWESQWPIKPEVVLEGGNLAKSPAGTDIDFPESLSLLTTHREPETRPLIWSGDTSAAVAQAARLAAEVRATYPGLWPETVRALLAHSAQWTHPMRRHLEGTTSKRARGQLLRRYGYGVPDLARALRSADNALTLIAEERIAPFAEGKMNEMHLHPLPWPVDVLRDLGEVGCALRVTLSYFVEPNPGRRGWRRRHQYASHGLRYEVKTPTESPEEFRRRINQIAVEEDGQKSSTSSDSADWFLGAELRGKGSLHADLWSGSAAELADRGFVAVYPVSGWWKDRKAENKEARYALIVSIEVPDVDVDIYSVVANQIPTPVEIATS